MTKNIEISEDLKFWQGIVGHLHASLCPSFFVTFILPLSSIDIAVAIYLSFHSLPRLRHL